MTRLLVAVYGFALTAPDPLVVTRFPDDPVKQLTATARLDADSIRLSGEVRLTLAVEGPGPLEVTPGKPLLTRANQWRVWDDGLPLREKQAGGREKWSQVYRLSPLVPGEPKVALAPLTVRTAAGDSTLRWDGELGVKVATTVTVPAAEAARPATDIEALPIPPAPPPADRPWVFAVVPVLLGIAAVALVLVKRKRAVRLPRDAAWAVRELSAAEGSADRSATVLRQYLAFRFGIPTDATTTPELAAGLRAAPAFPPGAVAEWQALFEEFDVARFSGTPTEVRGLTDRAKDLVGRPIANEPAV